MLRDTVMKCIDHMNHPLKDGKELELALKAKMTKKEYKILKAWADKSPIDELKTKLRLDDARYEVLSQNLIRKLNQERTKQALAR